MNFNVRFPQCLNTESGTGDIEDGPPEHIILHNFLKNLYQKFQNVLNGHIFALNCTSRLTDNTGFEFPYTKRDVAAAIQNEVKALLYDYLTGSNQNVGPGAPVVAISEMLKDTKKGNRTNKQVFRLNSQPDESLKRLFNEHCTATSASTANTQILKTQTDDILNNGPAEKIANVIQSGHKVLITPSSANILVSFKPTIEFMRDMEKSISMKLSNFKIFLDDFIFNVYLPQVEEQVSVYHYANINGIDAFQADRNPDANYPLIRSALCMILAMHGICRTIKCMPVHANELLKFLDTMIVKYYDRCSNRFHSLLVADESSSDTPNEQETTVLSFGWACSPEIRDILDANTYLYDSEIDLEINKSLNAKETIAEISKKGERSFHRLELFLDIRRFLHMSHLHYGIEWLLNQIEFMRGSGNAPDMSQEFTTLESKAVMVIKFNRREHSQT